MEKNIKTDNYDTEDLDYKDAVKVIVAKEYETFEREMTEGKTAMDVFANNYQIYVKTELMRAICEEVEFDDEVYKALYQDRGNILKNLHEDFISEPEASLNTKGDAAEFIEGYCNRYHGEIMEEGQTQGIKM